MFKECLKPRMFYQDMIPRVWKTSLGLLLFLMSINSLSQAETQSSTLDSGYEFMDGSRYIYSSEANESGTSIPYNDSAVQTPCQGVNLPADKTYKARVEPGLDCDGQYPIHEIRGPENFENHPEYKRLFYSGVSKDLFRFLRENERKQWTYSLAYKTSIHWTWKKKYTGRNGDRCGYTYTPRTCVKKTKVETRNCWTVADPVPDTSTSNTSGTSQKSNTGAVIGGAIGAVIKNKATGSGGGSNGGGSGSSSPLNGSKSKSYESHNAFSSSRPSFRSRRSALDEDFLWPNLSTFDFKTPALKATEAALDFIVKPAEARTECSSWSTDHIDTNEFTCYDRRPKLCEWEVDMPAETLFCSNEVLPIEINLVPRPEDQWNPKSKDFVPYLANGNELLPGEFELMTMGVTISGNTLSHSEPQIGGGLSGTDPTFYSYKNKIEQPPFSCLKGQQPTPLRWNIETLNRHIGRTPNSLDMALFERHTKNNFSDSTASDSSAAQLTTNGSSAPTQQDPLQLTGLFNSAGQPVTRATSEGLTVSDLPTVLRILDRSSTQLSQITKAFRNHDRGMAQSRTEAAVSGVLDEDSNNLDSIIPDESSAESQSEIRESRVRPPTNEVVLGQVSAGSSQEFWKDTFYRVQLVEVFPGRSKDPIHIAEFLVQTDSLIKRKGDLIEIPLAGQQRDTESAYDLTSSGVIFPKGSFRLAHEEYLMIPDQTYELRFSMLHRGIPLYISGCASGATSCERETPNPEAFSEPKTIRFVYKGTDQRTNPLRRAYDSLRRTSPW